MSYTYEFASARDLLKEIDGVPEIVGIKNESINRLTSSIPVV